MRCKSKTGRKQRRVSPWFLRGVFLLLLVPVIILAGRTVRLFRVQVDLSYACTALRSDDNLLQRMAARKLGKAGPPPAAIPDLLDNLRDDSWAVAAESAWCLGRMKTAPQSIVTQELREALHHPHREVRRYAAYSLAEHGPRSRAALPQLRELISDSHMGYMACRAIRCIGVNNEIAGEELVRELVELTESSHMGERYESVLTLGTLMPLPPEASEAIIRCSLDEEEIVRCAANDVQRQMEVVGTAVERARPN